MKRFKRWLAYMGATYGYTPRQSKELFVLVLASFVFLAIPIVYKYWLLQQPITEVNLPNPILLDSLSGTNTSTHSVESSVALRPFDPNTALESIWVANGTPDWLARRIRHYLAKGGHFEKPEDIKRIYDFPEELYLRLSPYFIFPRASKSNATKNKQKSGEGTRKGLSLQEPPLTPYPILDINTADSAALEALPGLGPPMAKRIVQYRKLLGGYASLQQVYEVYGQDSARTGVFLPYLKIHKGEGLIMIDINARAREGKLYHPYMPKLSAKLISAWVRQHGNMARPEQLLEHHLVDSAHYAKLLPYLSF